MSEERCKKHRIRFTVKQLEKMAEQKAWLTTWDKPCEDCGESMLMEIEKNE